jgi:hypothetical protein
MGVSTYSEFRKRYLQQLSDYSCKWDAFLRYDLQSNPLYLLASTCRLPKLKHDVPQLNDFDIWRSDVGVRLVRANHNFNFDCPPPFPLPLHHTSALVLSLE